MRDEESKLSADLSEDSVKFYTEQAKEPIPTQEKEMAALAKETEDLEEEIFGQGKESDNKASNISLEPHKKLFQDDLPEPTKIGDLVQLKSGSATMTVLRKLDDDDKYHPGYLNCGYWGTEELIDYSSMFFMGGKISKTEKLITYTLHPDSLKRS